jgi:hypothetical protein
LAGKLGILVYMAVIRFVEIVRETERLANGAGQV